jgi:hypothetical protein
MSTFETTRLPIAAYLHCSKLLDFVSVRKVSDASAVFEFLDPEDRGDSHEMDFEQGRAILDARAFAASERFLKNKMYRVLRQGGN